MRDCDIIWLVCPSEPEHCMAVIQSQLLRMDSYEIPR